MQIAIKSRHVESADYVQLMMRQTEVLLCVVKRTGGSPDQPLSSYVHSWLRTLPGGFTADLFPASNEPLRLGHLVSLYEFLEDLQADSVINSLPTDFRHQLPDSVREEIKQFANTNHVPIESFRMALRRFVMRNVIHFDPTKVDLKLSLATWITEPSLWPDGVSEDGTLILTEGTPVHPKKLKDEFPELPTLEHICNTVKFVDFIIEDRNTKLRYVPPTTKMLSPLTGATAKATRGIRTATKSKLGRT
jgi:hypothetical protein